MPRPHVSRYIWKRRFFSPFSKQKKINASTRGVFESFSPVHTKLLKRWKYDSMPYWACAMLWYNDIVKWRLLMYDIIVFENLRFRRSKRKRKPGKLAFSKICTLESVFEKMCFRWPFQYIFFSFILLLTSSSPCRKDQFAVLCFLQVIIVLIQVYNWVIRHHSTVCCCGLDDI